MPPTLETLELTAEELEAAKELIRKMAYQRWQDAGQPEGRDVEFWKQAENEWLQYDYVPHRPTGFDLADSPDHSQPHAEVATTAADEK